MAASTVNSIKNFIEDSESSASKYLSKDLQDGNVTLTDIIEGLGQYLTDKEHTIRTRATRLIADILQELPCDFLNEKQVSLLSTFLCEKLGDHHSLQPQTLYGLEALSKCTELRGESIEVICRTIVKEVHTQSLALAGRKSVYNIFLTFLTQNLQDVQKLGTDFVYGFMQAMDSEQDPRNLVLAFTCAQIVIQNFPLGALVEEMFEVVSCYFPIDFTPPPNDPSGITKDDLIQGLRRCLAATPKFAEYCLPLLMEKLTSDLKSAKIDALYTLAACAEAYGVDKLYEFQTSFFNCIKKEVFLSGDPGVEEAALTALKSLVKAVSTGVTLADRKKSLDGFIDEILAECKNHLLQPELMLMLSTGRLLLAAASGSDTACAHVVRVAVPLLIEAYNKQKQTTQRHNVISVLNDFMNCTGKFSFGDRNPILALYKDSVVLIYNQSLDDEAVSIQLLAIKGVHSLVTLPRGCLLDPELSFITAKLVNKSIEANCESHIRHECNAALLYLLTTYPDVVQNDVFPLLFNKLKNEPMETGVEASVDRVVVLEVISEVTCGQNNVKVVTDLLYDMLFDADYLDLYVPLSKCLSDIAERCVYDTETLNTSLLQGVYKIHELVVTKWSQPKWFAQLTSDPVLKHLSRFLRSVVSQLSSDLALKVQALYANTFLSGGTVGDRQSEECKPSKTRCDTDYVCLLTAVIGSGHSKKDIPGISEILDRLSELVFTDLQSREYVYVCKCLAALLNKHEQEDSLDARIVSLYDGISAKVSLDEGKGQGHTVTALAWITKALVLRGHKLSKQFTDLLVQLLGNSVLGCQAAEGFSIIMKQPEDVLTKTMHANIRLMYKQRFFMENLNNILDGYSSANSECKTNYLSALSYLIPDLNKTVLLPEISKIYPLLIQSLSCDDLDLRLVTMETLSDLISSAPDVIAKQLDSFIPQLLNMSTCKTSMKVRISALKCLSALTELPLPVMIPYRARVTRALLPVLDDKKRLVRAEAVNARQNWILMDMDQKT